MPIDTDLLKRTMAAVELAAERGEWNQGAWRTETDCGTAYCFAGWVAQLERREWVADRLLRGTPEEVEQLYGGRCDYGETRMAIGEWAARRLGLDDMDASELFDADNDLDDLRNIVEDLCNLAGYTAAQAEDGL